MVLCTICDEGIPKPGRRAHGKKPVNCGGACLTAYVEEHTAACQGKKVAYGTGMAPIPDEEASRAKSWNNSEDCSNGANKVFTEILNVRENGREGKTIHGHNLPTFAKANSRGFYPQPQFLSRKANTGHDSSRTLATTETRHSLTVARPTRP